jgi:methionyl-tRNA synthetase
MNEEAQSHKEEAPIKPAHVSVDKQDDTITIQDVMKLDLRIAEIIAAEEHPNADKLLVLKIKVGEDERQLVAGIKRAYSPDELVGKKIVIIANLKPAVLRGVESQGMLLAASHGEDIVLLAPEKDIASGAKVK